MRTLVATLSLLVAMASAHAADIPKDYEDAVFAPAGNCKDIAHLKFRKIGMMYTDVIGKAPDGNDILVDSVVTLFPSGNYFLQYTEYEVLNANTQNPTIHPLFAKNYDGTWQQSPVAPEQIDFQDHDKKLAFAMALTQMTIGDQRMIGMAFMPDFEREQARNHQIFTAVFLDTLAGYGESAKKYCEKPY